MVEKKFLDETVEKAKIKCEEKLNQLYDLGNARQQYDGALHWLFLPVSLSLLVVS